MIALYAVAPEDCIVWDPADKYDWFDFIHLYPSFYERYTLKSDGTPEKDVPIGFKTDCPSNANPRSTRRDAAKPTRARHR